MVVISDKLPKYLYARSNSMAFVTSQLVTLGMIEQPVWL